METTGFIIGLISFFLGIYTTWLFSKGIRISALRNIRMLINRMEKEKNKLSHDSIARTTMEHTQEDLDTLFKNLQSLFNIRDKDAPLT